MTKAQTAQLLTVTAALDRRTIGESDVEAWHLILAGLDVEDCMTAVREHYTDSRDWIMPADVHRRAILTARRREGITRIAAQQARIEAENLGALNSRPVSAITVGRTVPVDDEVRAERRRMLRAAAHTKRKQVEQDTAQRDAYHAAMQQARAELDALRESATTVHGGTDDDK